MSTEPPAAKPNPDRALWLAALAVTALLAALHVFFLTQRGGFWRDEATLIHIAHTHSRAELLSDSFPVLMGQLIRLDSAVFGPGDLPLKTLGLLVGLGILAALWRTAMLTRRAPPLMSLAFWGFNGTAILYGDSLRAYGLGSLLIIILAGCMWTFLKKPTWPRTAALAIMSILSVQALYQNAVLIAALAGAAWVICWRLRRWDAALKILLAGFAAALSLLPYWANLAKPSVAATGSLRNGFDSFAAALDLDTVFGYPIEPYVYVWAALALVVVILGIVKLFAVRPAIIGPTPDDLSVFAAAALWFGILGYAAFLLLAKAQSHPWHYLPLAAYAAMCLDLGLPWERPRWRAPVLGLALATVLAATPFLARDLRWRFTSADRLASYLAAHAAPDDFIVVAPWYCGVSYERYHHGPTPWDTIPPRAKLVVDQMQNPAALQPVLDQISTTLRNGHRVWVVGWMQIPAADAPAPGQLPPPPLKFTGWADTPYTINWTAQTAWFLRQHTTNFVPVKVPIPGPVNFNEDLWLLSASGWQTNAP